MGSAAPPSKPLVLVVEDDFLIRMYVVDIIEAAGFETVEADNADAAIAILMSRKDVTIVFTDIDMPGAMNGMLLASAIRNRWPPIEIIITSGHIKPDLTAMPVRGVFIPKPYNEKKLIDTLQSFMH